MKEIPYKIYLEENEMPKQWYNVRADMKKKPAPILNPATHKPVTLDELSGIFCTELARQELDDTTPYFDIPEEIRNFYKMYRPSPLVRAYCLEKKLDTPAHIYYKFEGNNTSGSHKLNSAIAQAYYAKKQGLKGVTTETGAGQWGTALSMACSYFDLDCHVYMVKCSYEQKPFRREVMRTYGAQVTPSPSMETEVGRKINAEFPGTTGSLGCAISEAVEVAVSLKHNALCAAHNGVMRFIPEVPSIVETSSNLAIVEIGGGKAEFLILIRSSRDSMRECCAETLESAFAMAGMKVELSGEYPAWQPNPQSEIVEVMKEIYRELFHTENRVQVIHAGLECGVIGALRPHMDLVSFGPTLRSPHTPNERCFIPSVGKYWDFVKKILERIPEKA